MRVEKSTRGEMSTAIRMFTSTAIHTDHKLSVYWECSTTSLDGTVRKTFFNVVQVFNEYISAVGHGEELLFVFMMPQYWENNSAATADDISIANWFGKTWTDFAKTG